MSICVHVHTLYLRLREGGDTLTSHTDTEWSTPVASSITGTSLVAETGKEVREREKQWAKTGSTVEIQSILYLL